MYSESGINDNNKGDSAGFAGHGNQCLGRERLFHRGDHPSAIPGPCRIRSNGGVVAIGDVRGGAHNSSGFVRIGGDLQVGDACVADEFGALHRVHGFSPAEIQKLLLGSLQNAWLSPAEVQALCTKFY